jgi:hypothetical protein
VKSSNFIPRSQLATIADMEVMKSEDEEEAARRISERIESNGIPADVSIADVRNESHWVVTVDAEHTNYDNSFRKIAIVPDMTSGRDFQSGHIGVVTPEDGRIQDNLN